VTFSWDDLPQTFPMFPRPDLWLPRLRRHAALIEEAATHTRVTAVTGPDVVRRQYAESLETLRIALTVSPEPEAVADVGSGGGFPGLVMAAVLPGLPVTLVEPLQKRARLLESIAADLGLGNVSVVAARAEDAGRGDLRERFALVTARAVAGLRELIEYTAPLARTGGWLALPKGSSAAAEVEAAGRALAELGCEYRSTVPMRSEVSDTGVVVVIEKASPTPARYPRRPGIPAKRPL
jgi:16S rRNA (guanine527-N7)-methyltransferase